MSLPRCHFDYLNWMIGKTITVKNGPRAGQRAVVKDIQPRGSDWSSDCIGYRDARFLVSPLDFAFVPQEAS